MTPTAIVKLADMEPSAVRTVTQKLDREIAEIEKHPEKATKIREIAKMAHNAGAPGDDPLAEGKAADSNPTLRSMMGIAQEQGRAEGRAVTKFQITLGVAIIGALWGLTAWLAKSAWDDMKLRVSDHDRQIQVILQDKNGDAVRSADVVRRLDKAEVKMDLVTDKLNEQSIKINEVLSKVNDLHK